MIRQTWMAMLAKMVAPLDAAVVTEALTDMLPLLKDLPDAAFCMRSLEDVARKCQYVPNYARMREVLGGWWVEHHPPQPALAGPEVDHYARYDLPRPRTPPTEAEKAATREVLQAWRMESAARQVAEATRRPARVSPPLSDEKVLALMEKADPNGPRTQVLRARLGKTGGASA